MGCQITFAGSMSVLAKVLCIAVLVLQAALLDYIIIKKDTSASTAGRYVWIALDAIVVIFWIITMVFSFRFFDISHPKKVPETGFRGKDIIKMALKELPFSYVSWLLYSIILVAKINRMFIAFSEKLTYQDETLLSNTSLKIILSLAGVIFALLAYTHHDEAYNSKYRLLIEKLGTAASFDLLDCIMLLDILFVVDSGGIELTYRFDQLVRAFSSICILLPVFPLFALRVVSASETTHTSIGKIFPPVMVLNSMLYLFLVNIPLFGIRMFLWVHYDLDVTTFLTKNVMAIFKGLLDIYKELVTWRRTTAEQESVEMEPVQMEPVEIEPVRI